MWHEQRKRFKSATFLLLVIFTLNNNAKQPVDIERFIFPQMMQDETSGQYHVMIEYITDLFCTNGTYRFNHIYVERSLSTGLADKLINQLNKCMTAGVLISR